MADEKFTGLPAGSSPFADTSVMAMSEDDGGFLSIKITVAQLKVLLGSNIAKLLDNGSTMDAEQLITFNSTGTNKCVIQDSVESNSKISLNDYGNGDITIGDADNVDVWCTVDGVDGISFGTGEENGDYGSWMDIQGGNFSDSIIEGGTDRWYINRLNNFTGKGNKVTNSSDCLVTAISTRTSTATEGVVNAVIAGGDTVICDKDGVLHTQTMSVKINDLGSTGSNQTLTIEDGAHVKITPTGNLTINVNTYSTNNTVNWTLEVDNSGGHTITQGTGIVNAGGGTWAAFATGTEVIEFKSMTSGSHLLTNQLANIS